jgi:hypothetical protein
MDVISSTRLCDGCGEPLPTTARPNMRHHNTACRTRAYARRRRAEDRATERTSPLSRAAALSADQQAVLDQATSEVRLVALVAKAAQTQWRAAAWLLERRHPERWASGREVTLPPIGGEPDEFAEVDQLAQLRRQRHERRPDGY